MKIQKKKYFFFFFFFFLGGGGGGRGGVGVSGWGVGLRGVRLDVKEGLKFL